MIPILLTYDADNWAFHLECQAIAWHMNHWQPGRWDPVIAKFNAGHDPADYHVAYCSAWYYQGASWHPRSVSQLSSHSYFFGGWEHHGGRPKLSAWTRLAVKNRDLFDRLTDEDHPHRTLLYHQFNPGKWPYSSPSDGAFVVGFAGHSNSAKGYGLIKEAAEKVGAEFVSPTWENGRLHPDMMPGFYHGLSAYVTASAFEGGPRTGIEAMLCGTPLVTTAVGQVSEMVVDGESALIVDRTSEAIADALERLKGDTSLRFKLSRNARAVAYDWCMRVGRQWVEFFAEVADS